MKNEKAVKAAYEILVLLLGALIYAVGYRFFIEPCRLVLGGATGVATILHYLFFLPVGLGFLFVNLPLLLLGWRLHGWRSVLHSAFGILASSLALEAFSSVSSSPMPLLLGAIFGGTVSAVGISMLLWYGFTTGGTELAAVLIRERFSRLAIGKIILLIDTAIVLGAVFLLKQTEMLAYSVILNVSFALTLDLFMSIKAPKKEA